MRTTAFRPSFDYALAALRFLDSPHTARYIEKVASAHLPQDRSLVRGESPIHRLGLISGFILAIILLPLAAAPQAPPPAQQPAPPAAAQQPMPPAPGTPVEAVSPVSVQQSPQLFAALCAAHAGGYQANVPESEMSPLHAAIRREIAKASGPAVDALREFYRNHELPVPVRPFPITFPLDWSSDRLPALPSPWTAMICPPMCSRWKASRRFCPPIIATQIWTSSMNA